MADESPASRQQIVALQEAGLNYTPAFLRLCIQRGLTSPEAIRRATDQAPQTFHDPFLLYQMDKVVERLEQAIGEQELITIYGDYDADGITSTLILYEALESIGANVNYYLPNRLIDGYGPNIERYKQLIEEGTQLILTCDNGIAGHQAIDFAMQAGVDVIVTDHHQMQESLPNAYAIIHPQHPLGDYPFKDLSGAGVALKVVAALTDEVPAEALELAAIGTVADLVSLTDENRTIVINGLNRLRVTQREGLRQLFKEQSMALSEIQVDEIGFIIAPRLNAVGRLGDPTPGLELLRTFDPDEARQYVNLINEKNDERKQIVNAIVNEVEQRIANYDEIPAVIIEYDEKWPAGVLGIVASRLVEQYQRPAIIFQYISEQNVYRGSGRSIESINLFEALTQVSQHIKYFGGHSQAAGLTIDANTWTVFKTALMALDVFKSDLKEQAPALKISLALTIDEISNQLIEEIDLLGPFGTDNPKPIFVIKEASIDQLRWIGTQQQHLKLLLSQKNKDGILSTLNVIGFNCKTDYQHLQQTDLISIVGDLTINEWQQNKTPQLKIKDIGFEGSHWVDKRGSQIPDDFFSYENTVYLFEHTSIYQSYQKRISKSSVALLYKDVELITLQQLNVQQTLSNVAIVEPPSTFKPLKNIINIANWQTVYVGSYIQESKYLLGVPSREETTRVYRWIQQYQPLDMKNQMGRLSQQTQLPKTKIKLILKLFFQAKFVTIQDGHLFLEVNTKQKVDLQKLPAMDEFRESMQVEACLNYQSINQVKNTLEKEESE